MNNTNTTNGKRKWDEADIGVLWSRETKAGDAYFTGKVNIGGVETALVIFSNKNKYENGEVITGKEKHPDYRIYISEPKENRAPATTPAKTAQASPAQATTAAKRPVVKTPEPVEEEAVM